MKFSKLVLALMFSSAVLTSCKDAAKAPEDSAATATNEVAENTTASEVPAGKLETASFEIEGMSCAMGCAKAIENKLAKLDGVQKAEIDFEKKTAKVEFDASKQSSEKIVETVEAAADGKTYKVINVKSSGDQAMFYMNDQEKEKKKKKSKSKTETATAAPATPATPSTPEAKGCGTGSKPACCAAKKSCSEAKTL